MKGVFILKAITRTKLCKFRARLLELFWQPLKRGETHPAEKFLARVIAGRDGLELMRWGVLTTWYSEDVRVMAVYILRLLPRLKECGDEAWRVALVAQALKSEDPSLRGAALFSAAQWGGSALLDVLMSHAETDWVLEDYQYKIIGAMARDSMERALRE